MWYRNTVRWALIVGVALLLIGCGDKPAKDGAAPVPVVDKGGEKPKEDPTAPKKDGVKESVKDPVKEPVKDAVPVKDTGAAKDGAASKDKAVPVATKDEGVSLFDGKTLGKWKATNFGGEGEVEVKDGQLVIHAGSPLSGVTWQGEVPMKIDYEISLEAQRTEGDDFFLALTVPVKDDSISLILGGWGGTVVGLSSLDGQDASENETTQFMNFKQGQWYKVKMVVTEKLITVFIDDKQLFEANLTDRKVGTRIEVDLSKPLGIATYSTMGSYRNLVMKKLK